MIYLSLPTIEVTVTATMFTYANIAFTLCTGAYSIYMIQTKIKRQNDDLRSLEKIAAKFSENNVKLMALNAHYQAELEEARERLKDLGLY